MKAKFQLKRARRYGLAGIKARFVDAVVCDSPRMIERMISHREQAATAESDDGQLNVWRDDRGQICCEFLRRGLRTEEPIRFTRQSDLRRWLKFAWPRLQRDTREVGA
jgi:hypothetical protein